MTDESTVGADESKKDQKNNVLIASIVTAAVVSAATAAYIVWRKSQVNRGSVDSVQDLLDKAHRTLHILENRLEDLRDSVSLNTSGDGSTVTA
ncbi:MAG: hypothetical protein H7145_06055 [Akkermansiaceae bacterium]|nr:hypothetical protein [Armatimonadota bacterium]